MRYGSVCSGIEAATVAWYPLGWRAAFYSEIDAFPCALLAHYYPDVHNFGDMTRFQEWPDAAIDVLVGGTPCQSFSVAGLRKGLADPRGNLALTYLAIAARYRPRWLVWENVPGVLSSAGGRDFASFLGGLGELGYGWAYRVLDAQYFGVPQRRRRVFVVGCARGWAGAAAVLFERESMQGHPAPSREAGERTPEPTARSVAIRGRDGTPQAELGDDVANAILTPNGGRAGVGVGAVLELARCVTAREGSRQDYETETLIAHALRADGFDASEDGTGRGTPLVSVAFTGGSSDILSQEHVAQPVTGRNGDPGMVATWDERNVTSNANRSRVEYGAPANTLHSEGLSIIGPTVRRLTPRECERLQGFPDDYTLIPYRGKPAADGPRYKALGNSMAVPVMRWLGERIALVDDLIREAA